MSGREREREQMIREQLIARGIASDRVLAAMRAVAREEFVEPAHAAKAYDDGPLPIGDSQTISQPYMVARMTELLELDGSERVLEVGAGSGYQTAVLAHLASEVFAVERVPRLAALAAERVAALSVGRVRIECFDGTHGWAEHAPFGGILVAAGSPRVPPLLCDQLEVGAHLVIPVGERDGQKLLVVTRTGEGFATREDTPCRFVDLVGRYGWSRREPPRA